MWAYHLTHRSNKQSTEIQKDTTNYVQDNASSKDFPRANVS